MMIHWLSKKKLDEEFPCVTLPASAKGYLISRPLKIHSNQELRLDRWTSIRLAPESNCHMLENANPESGNERISVSGGIWDFDNLNQAPNPGQHHNCIPPLPKAVLPEKFDRNYYYGMAIYFENVRHLELRSLTVRNPVTYAIHCCRISDFTIDTVNFEMYSWNPVQANMDGVHLEGGCHHGRICNLKGRCFDDLLAINANDISSAYLGECHDIDVDGIYCEECHSAIRLLSAPDPVRNITIRNIHGTFYRYMVGITQFFRDSPRGKMDHIIIENCFCGKALQPSEFPWPLHPFPLILIEGKLDIGSLFLRNLHREEFTDPQPFIALSIDADTPAREQSHVRQLSITDCSMINHCPEPLEFFRNQGRIDLLDMRNNRLESAANAGPCLLMTSAFTAGF